MQNHAFRETQPKHKIYGTLHEIAQTAEEKDLGVTIDDKLIFSRHIQIQVNKANSAVGLIRHIFKHLDNESFLYLYKSLVRPHLEYASVIWSPKMKKHQDSIEKVQRRATRLLPEIFHLSYTDKTINPWSTLFKVQTGKN